MFVAFPLTRRSAAPSPPRERGEEICSPRPLGGEGLGVRG